MANKYAAGTVTGRLKTQWPDYQTIYFDYAGDDPSIIHIDYMGVEERAMLLYSQPVKIDEEPLVKLKQNGRSAEYLKFDPTKKNPKGYTR